MRRHFVIAAIVAVFLISSGSVWLLYHPLSEGSYRGKSITWWVRAICTNPSSPEIANNWPDWQDPKAFPILVRALEMRDGPVENAYRKAWPMFPTWLKRLLGRPIDGQTARFKALVLLNPAKGNDLTPAIPALVKIVRYDVPPIHRDVAASWLGYSGKATRSVTNALIAALHDQDPGVRNSASNALKQLKIPSR